MSTSKLNPVGLCSLLWSATYHRVDKTPCAELSLIPGSEAQVFQITTPHPPSRYWTFVANASGRALLARLEFSGVWHKGLTNRKPTPLSKRLDWDKLMREFPVELKTKGSKSKQSMLEKLEARQISPTLVAGIREVYNLYGGLTEDGQIPESELEFKIKCLGMLTDSKSRAELRAAEEDRQRLQKGTKSNPNSETTGEIKEPNTDGNASATGAASSAGGDGKEASKTPAFWAKGTGYGHGASSNWDMDSYLAKQEEQKVALTGLLAEILRVLTEQRKSKKMSPNEVQLLEDSCLLTVIESRLVGVSFVDLEKHQGFYSVLLSIISELAASTETVYLLSLPGQRESMLDITRVLAKQAKFISKVGSGRQSDGKATATSAATSGSSSTSTPLAKRILKVASAVEKAVQRQQKLVADMKKQSGSSSGTGALPETKEAKDFHSHYMQRLGENRLGMVEDFAEHHYVGESIPSFSADLQRRLQSEFFDLRQGLPIHPDSSAWMRVKKSNISLAQLIITPAPGTPYARGCFIFDIFFPSNYPDAPPKVNLATTGGGSFRFNPNLYNSGKVCLSLLNTWNGSKSEKWNPALSTFYQVVLSIQSLIFVPYPYFNEPGFENQMGTDAGRVKNNNYNANVRNAMIKFAMIDMLEKPPKGFEYEVRTHFYLQRDNIIKDIEGWLTDGVSTGSKLKELHTAFRRLKPLLAKLTLPDPPKEEESSSDNDSSSEEEESSSEEEESSAEEDDE